MSKWEKVRLGEVCSIVSGTTPKSNVQAYWNGKYNWVTPAELTDDTVYVKETQRKITRLGIEASSLKSFPAGTVLLSSRAPIGKVAIAGTDMYCNQGFKNLICSDKIYNKYLYWFLKIHTSYLNSLGRGATFKEISKKIVEQIEIPLPPFNMQSRISNMLDAVSNLIKLRKQKLVELDKLVQSAFYDIFGDPVTNEKRWDKIPFRNILIEKPKNGFFAKNSEYSLDGNAYVVWISDFIDKATCNINGLKRIDISKSEIQSYEIHYGDLLFCRSSLTKPGIGKCAYVPKDIMPNTIFECDIIKTKVNLSRVNPAFLQAQTTLDYFRNQIVSRSKTSTMTTIGQDGIVDSLIVVPPIELQNAFENIVQKIEEQKGLLQQSIIETQELFDSLMSQYFE